MKKLDKETEQSIAELARQGMPRKEIAKRLGVNKNTVSAYLGKSREWEDNLADEGKIKALRKAGWKIKDIAWDMKISEKTVQEILEKTPASQ